MKLVLTAAALAAAAPAAHAQAGSLRNASEASKQVVMAGGAIGESGLKASSGVVAIPLGALALASGAVGVAANASGHTDVGTAFDAGSKSATEGARAFVDFSGAPLTVTNEVVVGRQKNSDAQPAPQVPYTPAQ
jgi:hypothetical protein